MASRFSSDKKPLIVSLENPSADGESYQTIRVGCGDEYLDIELRRTLRLPSDNTIRSVPAGYGCFPVYVTERYASKLPKSVQGGAFIPIYQREAMWINFNTVRPFQVKIYANDLNIITGKPAAPTSTSTTRRTNLMRRLSISLRGPEQSSFEGPIPQDYVVPPKQTWIDGVVKQDGVAQQFVASPIDTADGPVENVVEAVKIKFEITPTMNRDMWVYVDLASEPTVPMLRLEVNEKDNVRQLIDNMLTKMAIPLSRLLRISFDGEAVGPFDTLQSLQAFKGDIIYVYLDQQINASGHGLGAGLTAGRPVPPTRRGSPSKLPSARSKSQIGGVEQIIYPDFLSSSDWDTKNRAIFPVYLIRASDFKSITGFDPPQTPINSAAYVEHRFELPETYIEPGMVETPLLDTRSEEVGKENRVPQGEDIVFELPAFEDDSFEIEFNQQESKNLSIRNFT